MRFLYLALFSLGIVAADQYTKFLTIMNIIPRCTEDNIHLFTKHLEMLKNIYHMTDAQIANLPSYIDGIPGVFQFSHYLNDGAAFSSFEGQQWLFALVFVAFTVLILWEYFKKPMPFTTFERVMIAAVYGGGLGNMIDRVRLGYVVDMIETQFIQFPVFNVADCFITCGGIALVVSLVFFNKAFWKDEKK